jgi:hypothetical protein
MQFRLAREYTNLKPVARTHLEVDHAQVGKAFHTEPPQTLVRNLAILRAWQLGGCRQDALQMQHPQAFQRRQQSCALVISNH